MKQGQLAEIKDHLSRFLHEAGKQDIVIAGHGKPAGVLIGFESEYSWLDCRFENDAHLLKSTRARGAVRAPDKVFAWKTAT